VTEVLPFLSSYNPVKSYQAPNLNLSQNCTSTAILTIYVTKLCKSAACLCSCQCGARWDTTAHQSQCTIDCWDYNLAIFRYQQLGLYALCDFMMSEGAKCTSCISCEYVPSYCHICSILRYIIADFGSRLIFSKLRPRLSTSEAKKPKMQMVKKNCS